MKQLERFLNVGQILTREELRNVKGGQEAKPQCDPGQNLYNCTVTYDSGSSSSGYGCGIAPSQANQSCENYYAQAGVYVSSCICS